MLFVVQRVFKSIFIFLSKINMSMCKSKALLLLTSHKYFRQIATRNYKKQILFSLSNIQNF